MRVRNRCKGSLISWVLILGALFVFVSQSLLLFWEIRSETFNPLGKYTNGEIHNAVRVSGFPEVNADEDVRMSWTRCLNSDEPVQVLINAHWGTVTPRGTNIVTALDSPLTREPGCHDLSYSLDVPDEVVERTKELEKETGRTVVWQIKGSDTPIDGNGSRGAIKYWEIDPLVVNVSP
jgi:hypothetical protein